MITYWHNPRCSKSRQALALLEGRGVKVNVRLYLKDPPSEAELSEALKALGASSAVDLMRRGEKRFAELGLDAEQGDATLIAAMAANPILIERPLAWRGNKAVIGRPPEAVLTLL